MAIVIFWLEKCEGWMDMDMEMGIKFWGIFFF